MNRRPLTALTVLAVAAAALTTGSAVADPATGGLSGTISAILADARMDGGQASVVVRDGTTGELLYEHGADTRLMPASNTKLLTSAAAMSILGPDYTFTTDVRTDGKVRGHTLRGDLFLRGTGDPTLLAEDYDALAAELADRGVRTVRGDLVADDTWFDDVRLGDSWGWDDESYYYSAQISALNVSPDTDYDPATVIVTATPGTGAGADPAISVQPPTGYVTIDNRATTVPAGEADTLTIEREHGTNTIAITGQIPVGASPTVEWATVWEPAGYAADVFRRALKRHGVRVTGDTVLGEATPGDATVLTAHESMTLAELLIPFMKLSNNMHAEILTKAIGRETAGEGTWNAGLAAINAYVTGKGMDAAAFRQSDGSGLTRRNLIPAREFVDLLTAVRDEPWFGTWYESLPIAGEPDRLVGGTLRNRMRNTPAAGNVHAKTGSLTGASGLSGYVTDADGHQLVFSILLNDYLASTVKPLEDLIVVALASYTRTDTEAAMSSLTVPEAAPEVPGGLECSWVKPAVC